MLVKRLNMALEGVACGEGDNNATPEQERCLRSRHSDGNISIVSTMNNNQEVC